MKNSRQREDSLLHTKSYDFALRIVGMNKYLREQKGEFVLSKQILLIRESEFAQSQADFVNKLSVALKEANETDYWLNLLHDSHYLNEVSFISMENDCGELIALLVSSIRTVKNKLMKKSEE